MLSARNRKGKFFSFIKATFADTLGLLRSKKKFKSLWGISLYRNTSYLIMNSAITAITGVAFWIVVARLYSPQDVGLGSALLSALMFLPFLSRLGFDFGLIRFLSNSNDKAGLLNSSLTISALASIVIALIFLTGLPFWSPKLLFIRENPIFFATFIIFVIVGTIDILLRQTFIGFRRAGFILARSIIASVLKLLLGLAFASFLKVFGIFASWGIGITVASIVSLFLFLPQVLSHYRFFPSFQKQITNEIVHFSFANYIGDTLQNAPTWLLPLMVVNILGAEANAYFYIPWAITTYLLAIPMSTSMSFFAEGSHKEQSFRSNLKRSVKLISLLLVPTVIILFLLGNKLLLLFSREYSEQGAQLLQLLTLAAIPASINWLYLGAARIEKKLRKILSITGAIAFGTLGLSYLLLHYLGILGVGVGWLTTQTVIALVLLPDLIRVGSRADLNRYKEKEEI